jgi:hypothetical protein
MAQKQIAPTTQIIRTPIKIESIAAPCVGVVTSLGRQRPRPFLLLCHSPSDQYHSSSRRRRNDRRHQPAAEYEQQIYIITDECASNAYERARANAASRSGELAGEPGRPSKSVEKNTGYDTDYEDK